MNPVAVKTGRIIWLLLKSTFLISLGVLAMFLYVLGWLLEAGLAEDTDGRAEDEADANWLADNQRPMNIYEKDDRR